MPVFFGGRLWITPAVMSAVDDSQMANRNPAVGNVLAVIGLAKGGKPQTVLRFGDPTDARRVLRSGNLLDAVLAAFDPSNETGGPATVLAVRVDPATPSTLTLKDGGGSDVIELASTDHGQWTGQIKVKIEAGSTTGKKITTQVGNDYYVGDNIARNAFTVHYTGGLASATISVSGDNVTLAAPSGSNIATLDLATFPTVQQLVGAINAIPDFEAAVTDGNGERPTLDALDYAVAQDCKTAPYQVTAHLQAIVDWFNSAAEGFVTATRAANAGSVPANIGWTYLSGGSDGTPTNADWSDALALLQAEEVQWIVPATGDPAIHAMVDAHVQFMSGAGQKERRAVVGTALGTSDAAAVLAAKALNSDRTSLVHLGHYDFDAAGRLTLYPPYITAARVAGMFAGVTPDLFAGLGGYGGICRVCGRVLSDPESVAAGIGPVCAGKKHQRHRRPRLRELSLTDEQKSDATAREGRR